VIWVADFDAAKAALAALPDITLFAERSLATHDGKAGRELGAVDADGHALVVYHV
jgi:hypothetical protein